MKACQFFIDLEVCLPHSINSSQIQCQNKFLANISQISDHDEVGVHDGFKSLEGFLKSSQIVLIDSLRSEAYNHTLLILVDV